MDCQGRERQYLKLGVFDTLSVLYETKALTKNTIPSVLISASRDPEYSAVVDDGMGGKRILLPPLTSSS